jgi:TolB protein
VRARSTPLIPKFSSNPEFELVCTWPWQFPAWSPAGDQFVYVRGGSALLIVNEDGAHSRLLFHARAKNVTFPSWSPRGERTVFTSFRDGNFEVYTIHSDGTDLKRLTHTGGNDAHSVWSPNGKWLVFSSSRCGWKDESFLDDRAGPQPYGELFAMRADGTNVRQLTDNQWEDALPAWMPESDSHQ